MDEKANVGCMACISLALLAIAGCVLVGHFFGMAIGFAALAALASLAVMWVACAYYKAYVEGGDE